MKGTTRYEKGYLFYGIFIYDVEYLYQEYENNDKSEVVTAQLAYEF
jgi:hypothetical protein